MKVTQNIENGYASIRVMNDIAGNLTNVTDASIDAQISFIFEELQETITAFEAGDKVGVLDGAIDLLVTVAGLMQKLEVLGYDVATAMARVNSNNLSKFPPVGEAFTCDPEFTISVNEKYQRQVIKDAVGKFRKSHQFKSVDLSDLVPKEVA